MQFQPVNASNSTGLGIRTDVRTIPTEVAREAVWDLSNRYPHSSQSTIGSVVNGILAEGSAQLSTKSFSADYHPWDDLFLVGDQVPEETGQALQNQGAK